MSVLSKFFAIAVTVLVACPTQLHAQFGYIGADLGFSRMKLDGAGKPNRVGRTIATLSASYRPIQNLAIGASVPFTLGSSSEYHLKGSNVWGGASSVGRSARYKPNMMSKLELKEAFSVFVRWFPDAKSPIFLEARVSSFQLDQSFTINRWDVPPQYYDFGGGEQYPAIPGVSDGFKGSDVALAPGFSFGILTHVGEKGFFLASMDMDFVQFDMPTYAITLESDYDIPSEWHKYTTLQNATSSATKILTFRIGGGFRF